MGFLNLIFTVLTFKRQILSIDILIEKDGNYQLMIQKYSIHLISRFLFISQQILNLLILFLIFICTIFSSISLGD